LPGGKGGFARRNTCASFFGRTIKTEFSLDINTTIHKEPEYIVEGGCGDGKEGGRRKCMNGGKKLIIEGLG